jgi:gluconate 2-dehydrogenase gamma chain
MDRRKYLKSFTLGTVGAGVLLESCKTETQNAENPVTSPAYSIDRYREEVEREEKLKAETFFTDHEMKTITVLADIIIPKDDVSGSASDAGVPDFISFIVKDIPSHQVPMRGGLKWLDVYCLRQYGNAFITCSSQQQIEVVDQIAYPEKAAPEMKPGVVFFNRMRDLTATGFFTSKIGIADLGYAGNRPNQWNGVPDEVLAQYGLKYDDRTNEISAKYT